MPSTHYSTLTFSPSWPWDRPSPAPYDPIDLKTVKITGHILLPASFIFTLINTYFILVIFNNWRRIRDSLYVHSYILCIMLTMADLLFSLLVGFPAGLHMSFFEILSLKHSMKIYSKFVSFFLVEYLLILRVLVVGVLAADKCLQLTFPLRYGFFIDIKKVTKLAIAIMIIPVLTRVVPDAVDLYSSKTFNMTHLDNFTKSNPPEMYCDKVFINRTASAYPVPLTCVIDLTMAPKGVDPSSHILRDFIVRFLTVFLGFLVIIICDIIVFIRLVVNVSKQRSLTQGTRRSHNGFLGRTLCTLVITGVFALTNIPYVVIRLQLLLLQKGENLRIDYNAQFISSNLMFLSLLFHPWIYLLKMKTIRNLVMCQSCSCVRKLPNKSHPTRLRENGGKNDLIQMRVIVPARSQ